MQRAVHRLRGKGFDASVDVTASKSTERVTGPAGKLRNTRPQVLISRLLRATTTHLTSIIFRF